MGYFKHIFVSSEAWFTSMMTQGSFFLDEWILSAELLNQITFYQRCLHSLFFGFLWSLSEVLLCSSTLHTIEGTSQVSRREWWWTKHKELWFLAGVYKRTHFPILKWLQKLPCFLSLCPFSPAFFLPFVNVWALTRYNSNDPESFIIKSVLLLVSNG